MICRSTVIAAIVGAVVMLQHVPVAGQSTAETSAYLITDIGTLGGTESAARAINEQGKVAGWAQRSDGAPHAFFFDGTLHDLGTLSGGSSSAWGINVDSTVVGEWTTALSHLKGFIFTLNSRRSLGTFGGSDAAAYAVNDFNDVVGTANTTNNLANRAFLYRNGTMKSLGTLGGDNSVATAINNGGDIAGFSTLVPRSDLIHAFLYRDGVMTDIGTLGTSSDAWGINSQASVVGRSWLASGDMHAFLFRGGAMMDLGTLGGHNSVAKSINDAPSPQIVGQSDVTDASGTHAFLYENGVMTDLNSRVPPASGWVLESADAINAAGEIAGFGTINGQRHAFLLTRPATLKVVNNGTDYESNLPREGVQVGRTVDFITTVSSINQTTAHQVVLTDTVSGPVTIESISPELGCSVAARTVTCRSPELGDQSSIPFELTVFVKVRVNAPGVFSHTAHATAANAVANPATDTETEDNIGIALKSFTLSKTTVAGGTAVSARVEITSLPNQTGSAVRLDSSNPAIAPVPSSFAVQRPTAFRTFNIVPPVVSEPTPVTITATYGLVTISQTLTVVPPAVKTLSLTRSTMIGSCQTAIAKVTLTGAAPAGGAPVALSTTTTGVHVPAAITVPAGATTASVSISADAVHALTKGVVTAAFGGVEQHRSLAVRPIFLTAVTLTPSSVTGGSVVSGSATIECAAPAGGLTATLLSTSNSAAMPTTATTTFAAGATSASFVVQSHPVRATATPSIRVTVNGVTKSAALTVKP